MKDELLSWIFQFPFPSPGPIKAHILFRIKAATSNSRLMGDFLYTVVIHFNCDPFLLAAFPVGQMLDVCLTNKSLTMSSKH